MDIVAESGNIYGMGEASPLTPRVENKPTPAAPAIETPVLSADISGNQSETFAQRAERLGKEKRLAKTKDKVSFFKKVGDFYRKTSSSIQSGIDTAVGMKDIAVDTAKEAGKYAFGEIGTGLKKLASDAENAAAKIPGKVESGVNKIAGKIEGGVNEEWKKIDDSLVAAGKEVKRSYDVMGKKIDTTLSEKYDAAKGWVENKVSETANTIKETAKGAVNQFGREVVAPLLTDVLRPAVELSERTDYVITKVGFEVKSYLADVNQQISVGGLKLMDNFGESALAQGYKVFAEISKSRNENKGAKGKVMETLDSFAYDCRNVMLMMLRTGNNLRDEASKLTNDYEARKGKNTELLSQAKADATRIKSTGLI